MNETITEASTDIADEAAAVIDAVSKGNITTDLLADFGKALLAYLPTVIGAIIIFIIGKIIAKILMKIIDKSMKRTRVDQTAQGFLKSLLNIVLSAFVIIIALSSLGIPMASIITVIGAASVAVGLALQSSLSNVAGGFIILFSKPFNKGDYIISNGIEGTVDEITILTTKLVTLDNKIVYIPNSMVSNGSITNFSREKNRRVDLVFSIAYDQDGDKALSIINKVMNEHEMILKDSGKEPFARISSLAESSVDITVRAWTNTENYWNVYFDLIEMIKKEFDKADIEIPYRKLDVNITHR